MKSKKNNKVLVLRKCTTDHTSNDGAFTYPDRGYVEAPDWDGQPHCGKGLHGLLWGAGSFDIASYGPLWQVIEVNSKDLIEFDGKCKFKCGEVLLTTKSQIEAINLLKSHPNYPKGNILNYDITDEQFAMSGYRSTQTAGDGATQTAGYGSTQTAGYWSTQTAGDWSTQTAGDGSTQTAGNWSMQTVGNWSVQTAGDGSTQTAGKDSVQIGYWWEDMQYKVAVRKVTKRMANKPYRFERGKWTLVKDKEQDEKG